MDMLKEKEKEEADKTTSYVWVLFKKKKRQNGAF